MNGTTMEVTLASTAAPVAWRGGSLAVASSTSRRKVVFAPSPRIEPPIESLGAIEVMGERFVLEREGRLMFLAHPVWSLVGSGVDIQGAAQDLRSEAMNALEIFGSDSPETLSAESVRMLAFAERFVTLGA